ncbi:hypothetical protein BpHYR1_028778 [Brachionus plicatilis]|uniref:Uncharacterized protein n=1 Tax=Brachionus plicatilis TaxID=10195 RepID=A0A3M7RSM9_BRAPC|nr:hypothetical protein BpHYR1_028778 [Brachionus plicatilis]
MLIRKKGSGRPAKIATKLIVAKLRAYFKYKSGQHFYLRLCTNGDWKAKNLKQIENKIRTCLTNMDSKVVRDHVKTVCFGLDTIRRHGNRSVQLLNSSSYL